MFLLLLFNVAACFVVRSDWTCGQVKGGGVNVSDADARLLLVGKVQRSGSTLLASMLAETTARGSGRNERVSVSKELLNHRTRGDIDGTATALQEWLDEADQTRPPLAAATVTYFPTDPSFHTITDVLQPVRSSLLVSMLVRTNSVKQAVSDLRVQCLRNVCGESNVARGQSACADAALPTKMRVSPEKLRCTTLRMLEHAAALYEGTCGIGATLGLPVTTVRYEELQQNATAAVEGLLPPRFVVPSAESVGLLKLTSDSLRDVLSNYDEVHAALAPVPCLLEMLEATEPQVFPPGCLTRVPSEWKRACIVDSQHSEVVECPVSQPAVWEQRSVAYAGVLAMLARVAYLTYSHH